MKEIEQKIIDSIKNSDQRQVSLGFDEIHKIIEKNGFGYCSPEFINHESVVAYSSSPSHGLELWYLIESYIANRGNEELQLKIITKIITETNNTLTSKHIDLSRRKALSDPSLIRNVYLSCDERLINHFITILPIPKPSVFYGYDLPPLIAEHQLNTTRAILTNRLNDKTIINAQRNFRAKKRRETEIQRVTRKIERSSELKNLIFEEKTGSDVVLPILDDANKPYKPKGCSEELANRIFKASKIVTLFTSIGHMTSVRALPSILNDGLYGRQTLETFNMNYKAAVLNDQDVKDGDYNVICFGPQKIQKSTIKDLVQIKVDYTKLQKDNPCIFFKQRDYGFPLRESRKVSLGDEQLKFCQTWPVAEWTYNHSDLHLEIAGIKAYSYLPKFSFIAYDVQNIHQILTLNFFRFIDTLRDTPDDENLNPELTKSIYDRIEKLDDEQLVAFLENMGKNFSDTAEFNFYGAHKLDFSIIQSFTFEDYTLDFPKFIIDLNNGDLDQLNIAKSIIPELFKSYGMIDYLLSKVTHANIRTELTLIRNDCVIPLWQMAQEQGLTAEDDLSELQQGYVGKGKTIRQNREDNGGDEEEETKRQAALNNERQKKFALEWKERERLLEIKINQQMELERQQKEEQAKKQQQLQKTQLAEKKIVQEKNTVINQAIKTIIDTYESKCNFGARFWERRKVQIEALDQATNDNDFGTPEEKMAVVNAVINSLHSEVGSNPEKRRWTYSKRSRLQNLLETSLSSQVGNKTGSPSNNINLQTIKERLGLDAAKPGSEKAKLARNFR